MRKTKEFGSGMWQSGPSDFISINALPDSLRVRNPTCAYRFYLLHCCNFNLVGRQFRRASANANSHIKFKRDDVIYYGSVEYFIALQIEDVWIPYCVVSVVKVSSLDVLAPAVHLPKVIPDEAHRVVVLIDYNYY